MLAAALLAWVSSIAAQSSRPTKQYSLSISRGPLASALDQFSKQTGLQIGADLGPPETQNRPVGPVVGRVTADAALNELLEGSDLTFTWQDPYTIRIYNGIVKPRAEDNVHEVVVTGTRIRDDDVGPAPVRVFSRGRIERYGVSSLADLTRYFTQQPFSFSEGYQPSGAQHLQMRGLGVDSTLVLINGRRAPPSANSISFNAFDLNTVPPTAVERIEVMTDSASAIYGADAVGGVVNIILRKDIKQPEVSLHYGGAAGGGDEQRVSAAIGSSSERLKSTLVFDYFERGGLIGAERDLLRNQDFTRFGGTDYRLSTANPGNVYSMNGRALPGLMLPYAAVPIGSSGVGLTPADFASTAGTRNLFSSSSVLSVVPQSNRTTGYGSVELELPRLTLFGEVLINRSNIRSQQRLPTLTREPVPATNPFNPFGVPVAVDYAFVGVDPVLVDVESDLTRLVAGSRGYLRTWDWEIAAVQSVEETRRVTTNDLDLSRVREAINSDDPASALNLFRDGPAGSAELLASLVAEPLRYHYSFGSSQLSGFFRGPLFQLPSGATELVVGGEWRREEIEYFDRAQLTKERDVASAFAEMKIPLLDTLSLKAALRGDRYGESSDALNPQYGLVWKPSNEWLLRATYGTSFRPPSLFELYQPRSESSFPVPDQRRGGAVTNLRFVIGGNPELDVVTARSFTTGFVFTPLNLPGMRLGGSYWRVVMDNRITSPSIDLLNREDEFPDRVIRLAPTEQDIQAGWPGALQALDISKMNYGGVETSGVDLEMSYLIERDLSCFQATLATTWVDEYKSRELFSTFPEERVGIAHIAGTVPKWRAVGTLTWKSHDFGATTTVRFIPSYQDAELGVGRLDRRLPSRTLVDLQAWLELGSLVGEESLFAGSKLTLGLMNATNEAPDFARIGGAAGYDVSQADLTQRLAYIRFSKRF